MDAATWMQRCVAHYSARLAAAPPDLAAEFVRMLDLREPLQFFAYESERFDWQALVAVHSPLAPDGLVEARRIEPWTATQAFEEALAHPLWEAPLPEPRDEMTVPTSEPDPTLRSAGLRTFSYVESTFRMMALWEPPKKPEATGYFQPIHYGCLVLEHRGSLAALPPEYPVDQAFESAQGNLERRRTWRPDPMASSPEKPGDVRGAYIVPRLRVGKPADQSLNNLARVKNILPGVLTHRTMFNGHRVLVTHNGFVALDTSSPAETVHHLNLIAAAMLELGYPCYVFRELDLADLYEPRDGADHGWGGRFSGSPRQAPGDDDRYTWDQRWLRTSEFDEILDRAANITARPYAIHLQNYLEAHTHLAGNEPDQSLLFGWAILERWLHDLWTKHTAPGEGPSFDTKLRRLHAAGHIDDDLHARVHEARKLRNQVMHGKGSATMAQAEAFLATVEFAIAGRSLQGPPRPTALSMHLAALKGT